VKQKFLFLPTKLRASTAMPEPPRILFSVRRADSGALVLSPPHLRIGVCPDVWPRGGVDGGAEVFPAHFHGKRRRPEPAVTVAPSIAPHPVPSLRIWPRITYHEQFVEALDAKLRAFCGDVPFEIEPEPYVLLWRSHALRDPAVAARARLSFSRHLRDEVAARTYKMVCGHDDPRIYLVFDSPVLSGPSYGLDAVQKFQFHLKVASVHGALKGLRECELSARERVLLSFSIKERTPFVIV
jgi:hypothetical protein